jgi:hypothetical protein
VGGIVSKATDALGLTDSKAGTGEMASARDLQMQVLKRLEDVPLPDYEKQRIAIEAMESPELVGELIAEELGPSALEQISLDPKMRQAQMAALESMAELGQVGLAPEDLAAARELQRQVGAQEQARQESILQQMERMGTGDSGLALAAKLSSSQAAANRAAVEADRLAQQAGQSRRAALAQTSGMAGNLRTQDYGEAARAAEAQDLINRFNVGQRMDVQRSNLTNRQRIAEAQVAQRNLQRQSTAGLDRQQFEDRMRKAGAEGGAMGNIAATQMQTGQVKAQGAGQLLPGLAQTGLAVAKTKTAFSS